MTKVSNQPSHFQNCKVEPLGMEKVVYQVNQPFGEYTTVYLPSLGVFFDEVPYVINLTSIVEISQFIDTRFCNLSINYPNVVRRHSRELILLHI